MPGNSKPATYKRVKNPIPVWLLALALLPCGLPFAGAAAQEGVEKTVALQPHRALYDITLRTAKSSSGIADIHGQMYFNMEEDCTAWTTTHRFILVYDYIDNPTSQVVSEFKTVEAKDGSSLEYRARRVRDGEVQEEIEGKAARPVKKGKFLAQYTKPEPMKIDLPLETLFPTQQTIRTINGGLAKQKFITGIVYDGSDTDGPYQVSGLILKPISEPERKRIWPKNVDRDLASQPGWRTQVAIFPLSAKNEASSDYEMDANLLQNGVITDMSIRYSDFAIGQSLKALVANPRPNCAPDAPPEKQPDKPSVKTKAKVRP